MTSIRQNLSETLQLGENLTFSNNLTFNWVICTPSGRGIGNHTEKLDWPNNTERRPSAQQDYFISTWQANQQVLYESYFNATYNRTNLLEAQMFAYDQSILYASGESCCSYNVAGTGWFWFTILSTIGYGNQAPVTFTGRALVYSAGFLSILIFGVVLAISGHVVTALVDDALVRCKLAFMNKHWIACIIYGTLYYLWMVIIAMKTVNWKSRRLGENFSSSNAYWFAYISTTTVGLGDYYLEPAVFTVGDLMTWPWTFLIGFIFLAAFLGKFAEFLSKTFGRGDQNESFVGSLLSQLKTTDMIGDVPKISDTLKRSNSKTEIANETNRNYVNNSLIS